jgi:hypothetical protein
MAKSKSLKQQITQSNFYQKAFCNEHGVLTLAQAPNVPAWVGFLSWIVKTWITTGWVHFVANFVFFASWMIWAIWETGWGINWFRRGLGLFIGLLLLLTWWPG